LSILVDDQSLLHRHLSQEAVTDLLQRHTSGREDQHKILFSLVVLEQWLHGNAAAGV
jgi:asparagine synthase (glutamine-hydrolysing)